MSMWWQCSWLYKEVAVRWGGISWLKLLCLIWFYFSCFCCCCCFLCSFRVLFFLLFLCACVFLCVHLVSCFSVSRNAAIHPCGQLAVLWGLPVSSWPGTGRERQHTLQLTLQPAQLSHVSILHHFPPPHPLLCSLQTNTDLAELQFSELPHCSHLLSSLPSPFSPLMLRCPCAVDGMLKS